jgi:hypothetical protein
MKYVYIYLIIININSYQQKFINLKHVLFTIWYIIRFLIPDMSKSTVNKIKQVYH